MMLCSCAGDACPYDSQARDVSIVSTLNKTCHPCAAVSFFRKTMQVNRMTATDSLGLIRACFTAQGGRGASFRYNRQMAPDIAATDLCSHRRQERYSSSNRLARPVNNLKPSSTDNNETPRLCRTFLLASTCACRQHVSLRPIRHSPHGMHVLAPRAKTAGTQSPISYRRRRCARNPPGRYMRRRQR